MSVILSQPRPILSNTTNVESGSQGEPPSLVTSSSDAKRPPERNWALGSKKRVKVEEALREAQDSDDSDAESDIEGASTSRVPPANMFGMRTAWMTAGPSSFARLPTRAHRYLFYSTLKLNSATSFDATHTAVVRLVQQSRRVLVSVDHGRLVLDASLRVRVHKRGQERKERTACSVDGAGHSSYFEHCETGRVGRRCVATTN